MYYIYIYIYIERERNRQRERERKGVGNMPQSIAWANARFGPLDARTSSTRCNMLAPLDYATQPWQP